ncbi:MAG: hypothetical protein M1482_10135 [Chloroflexi bacterium]|nr:hypothetical protein [Chloroflexota bacterium]
MQKYRVALAVIGLGLFGGLLVGLWIGWNAWPVQVAGVDISDLKPASQDDYLVLTAKDYAYDQDLARAQGRLAQLHDAKANERVAALAREYSAQGNSDAAPLAALALALGSTDGDIQLIATTATPTPSLTPAPTQTPRPTLTPILTPKLYPTDTPAPPTHTPRPRATKTPTRVPIPDTAWQPAYPGEWPPGVRYQPASVAAGKKYWHLVKALYCDLKDTRFNCANLPGGPEGIGVYVILAGGKAQMVLDGKPAELEDKSSDPQCQCTYELPTDGASIQVGDYPSDMIGGLALNSLLTKVPQTHVRYFLTFQLVTR